MLEVQHVSKLYENQRGVSQIDFSMKRGEIVGFLGPNGAGKTTTMRMITGYLNPTHGQILIDGMSMADHPKKARNKIGYLPESPPLYPVMTVVSYLRFIADLRGIPVNEQKQRIGSTIEKLGLQGRERQLIRGLSKGYRQRLGLAQAILHNPDLLILDEPTSGLDPKQIIEIRQLIKELGEKHTVLLSTHILPEVNALCNRVIIINQGKIVLDDQPDQIIHTMGDNTEITLIVKGSRETIIREIKQMDAVAKVQEASLPQNDHSDNNEETSDEQSAASTIETVKLAITPLDHQDIREALFFKMAELKMPILEMKKESISLEDVFLKLTTDEQTQYNPIEEVAENA